MLRSPESRRDHTRRAEPEAGLLTIQPEDVLRAADELLYPEQPQETDPMTPETRCKPNRRKQSAIGLDRPLAAHGPPHPRAAGLSDRRALPLRTLAARAPQPAAVAWSLALVLPGLWLRGYAAGYVKKNRELTLTGPYAHTRNPLYLGSMLIAAGFAVALLSWPVALVLAAGLR